MNTLTEHREEASTAAGGALRAGEDTPVPQSGAQPGGPTPSPLASATPPTPSTSSAPSARSTSAASGRADAAGELLIIKGWLVHHMALVPGVHTAQVYLHGTTGPQLAVAVPSSAPARIDVLPLASRAYQSRRGVLEDLATPGQPPLPVAVHPLFRRGRLLGTVLLIFSPEHRPDRLGMLALAASAGQAELGQAAPGSTATATPQPSPKWQTLVAACASARDGAIALTLEVARSLPAERATLLLCDQRERLRICGSTDGWESDPGALAGEVTAVAAEALDCGHSLRWPPFDESRRGAIVAHRQLSARRAGRSVCTVPWFVDGRKVGALVAEREPEQPFTLEDAARLEEAAAALAPWFSLRQRLDRPWWQQMREQTHGLLRGRRSLADRVVMVAVAAALAVLLAWPIDSEIAVPARLEGIVQRTLAAPVDAYLREVAVRPGDSVKAGQLLLQFDAEDLRVERERLRAEAAGYDAAAGDAMGRQDMAALALQHAKLTETRARLDLLDQRMQRASLTAPFDGVVIQGDLTNAVGSPFKRGDPLLVLAPSNSYRAVVEIDSDRLSQLPSGTRGSMVLTALPAQAMPLQIGRVTPLAVSQAGRSYFEAEVQLLAPPADPAALRPGLQGIARFVGDQGPRALVWLRELQSRLRFAWWRWGV
jgi:multidrug efflux pump subunit AcrA (membrane-fusion protein)